MAALARDSRLDDRIDAFLSYLIGEWEAVPGVVEDWAAWSEYDRLDFALEWPIREDRLQQLRGFAEQGLLTSAQRRRYDQLLLVVERRRPTLEALFAELRSTRSK